MTADCVRDATPLRAEHARRARQLRRAVVLIATYAEPGPTRATVVQTLELLIAELEGMPARECRSCGIQFGLGRDEMKFYRSRGLALPTQCRRCRKRRRAVRSGDRSSNSPPEADQKLG